MACIKKSLSQRVLKKYSKFIDIVDPDEVAYNDLSHLDKFKYCISSVIRQSFFPFQNNTKNLDLSYKTDLDLWDCIGRAKLIL